MSLIDLNITKSKRKKVNILTIISTYQYWISVEDLFLNSVSHRTIGTRYDISKVVHRNFRTFSFTWTTTRPPGRTSAPAVATLQVVSATLLVAPATPVEWLLRQQLVVSPYLPPGTICTSETDLEGGVCAGRYGSRCICYVVQGQGFIRRSVEI